MIVLTLLPMCWPFAAGALDVKRYERSVVRVVVVVTRASDVLAAGHGTGFVIPARVHCPNRHVVIGETDARSHDGAITHITVGESGSGVALAATVLWASEQLDLAVLHVPELKGPALKLTNRSPLNYPPKGAEIWALGFPTLADIVIPAEIERSSATVTRGVVGRIGMGGDDPSPRWGCTSQSPPRSFSRQWRWR
jgi:hypothetical protein